MRNQLLAAALAFATLSPLAARAQEESPMEGEAQVLPGDGAPAETPKGTPGSSHTVERGDTLWDLSQKYLGSPWYWPKVWSYNPEIANPHWIYPGNLVRFFNSGEEVPTQVEVGDVPDAEPVPVDSGDKVQVAGRLTYQPKDSVIMRTRGFVTSKELESSGKIVGSFAETERFSTPQQFYANFKKQGDVRVGDKYVVFKTGHELEHPKTGNTVGYLTILLGEGRVVKVHDKQKMVTVELTATWDEIERGDLLGPAGENLTRTIARRANERDLKGYVVGGVLTWQTITAEHELLVIDQGSDQGVQPGNTFTVVRQYDGLGQDAVLNPQDADDRYPEEDVATCMATEVKSKASVCLVVRSLREVVPGDRVVMRAGSSVANR